MSEIRIKIAKAARDLYSGSISYDQFIELSPEEDEDELIDELVDLVMHEPKKGGLLGVKEKEHEVYFLEVIKDAKWLPAFEKVFSWGKNSSLNDIDLENKHPVNKSDDYCKNFKAEQ